jgi:hypothetical protein
MMNYIGRSRIFLESPSFVHICQIFLVVSLILTYILAPLERPESFEFGLYLEAGHRINAGQTIYKDWHFMYGPVVAYWASLVVKTGWSLSVLHRLFFLPDAIGTSVALYLCMRSLRLNLFSTVLVVIGSTSFFAIGSRWCGVIFVLALFSYSVVNKKMVTGYFSGTMVGLQVLYFQDIAVYTGATLCFLFIALLLTKRFAPLELIKLGALVIAGFASIALCFVVFLAIKGALPDYIDRAWVFTAKYYDAFDFADPPGFFSVVAAQSSTKYDKFLLPLFVRWISGTLSFYTLPIVGTFALVWYYVSVRRTELISTSLIVKLALSIIAIVLFRIVFKTGDTIKLAVNLFPAVLISLTLLHDTMSTRLRVVTLLVVGAIVSMTFYPYARTIIKARDGISKVETATAAVVSTERDNLVIYLKSRTGADAKFVSLPSDTLLYIDLAQVNPLSFDYFDPIVSPRYDAEFANEISKVGPRLIVVDTHATFWNKWKFGKNFGEKSYTQIRASYHLVKKFGTYEVFERTQ